MSEIATMPTSNPVLLSAQEKMANNRPLTIEEACAWCGKSKAVLYKWRSRLSHRKLITSPGRLILPKNLLEFLELNQEQ